MTPSTPIPATSAPAPTQQAPTAVEEAAERLAGFIHRHPRLLILTGAGVSTDSGIPDYRDQQGAWKRKQPVQHQDFMGSAATRQRYWGRSLIGWPVIRNSRPNPAHRYLAELELRQHTELLVTQNVDRLHQRAGSERVLDLHGRADQVVCMACGYRCDRQEVHDRCFSLNPAFQQYQAATAPDGDADLEADFSNFHVADCPDCGGILKPDVVFFGDNVPKDRVQQALDALQASDALLVIGSSLMVYSGFRFCRYAQQWHKPMAALNLGRTRADDLLDLKLNARIAETLRIALARL
ncbi:NAD-dependent protein deacetylase, SIR2 family [Microbulbifer donghaiensis]|uniref:NAD-dependent protein deacetylase n=1 Tax=Microbulbifer donghaiensis TaxID=494016 RepID=A0A1M5D0E5_9GAMM|nr:NAD-dependent protein deacetylase [Microbulbifer donghaiensis]SHF60476.1 NAD-dependent protein deacetylase, SIR2 family [Microbulbifer donghaiensis]